MLVAILCAGFTSAWANEVVAYTLTPASGSNNSYASNCDITISDITWNLTGNSTVQPWRIGGKSLNGVDRTLYSKTAIADNVSKIEVTHGAASSITVNSWTVIVASDANFTNVVSTLTPSFEANTTTAITKPNGADWSNCFYKFVYNVTVSGTSNKFIEFSKATFYKESGSSDPIQLSAPELAATANNGSVTLEWNEINNASSYTIQYADNASFTGATTVTDATSPQEISGLTNGTTYYFKAMTVGDNTNYLSSDYGDAVSATPANVSKITITQDYLTDFTNTYKWYEWTAGGVSGSAYAYKNSGMQFNSSKDGYWIYNTSAIPGTITSVKMVKASGTDRSWTLKAGTSEISSTDDGTQIGEAQTVGTSGATWNVNGSYNYFCLIVSGGSTVIQSIEITYIPSTDPIIVASDPSDLAYDATEGEFGYSITNPTSATLSATSNADWITNVTVDGSNSKVTFNTTANPNTTQRTGTITLSYTGADDKVVTITQAAAPVIYATIPELFDAATNTETEVKVTFNNWVVSGVSTNGKNVFVTDNNGNGFVIYSSTDISSTYPVGSILSGTAVTCNLVLYNGFAEIKNLDASNLTITTGGTVTAANVAMADLAGVNTGALVSYENLTCSVDNNKYYLSDGTTTIQVYNALYAFDALEASKTYNITGIYQQYNSTKELLPRSAADIVEVVSSEPSITVATTTVNVAATDDNGTIGITYDNLSISDESDFDIQFCDAGGNALSAGSEPTWIVVEVAEDNNDYVVSYIMNENTSSEARSAYFKVFAMGDADFVYSDLITVTQAGVVVDYATLPFEFDEGKSAIESTNGLTQEGLGTDYNSSPKLRFDNTDDYLILKLDAHNGATLSFDIKGNNFSDGTFTVQTSENGTDYTNLATYTELGTTQSESINLPSTVSYIKWIYTEKVSGNVALGNIKVRAGESVTVTSAGYAAIVTKNNVSFSNSEVTAYIVTATATNEATLTEVEEAPAGTPLIVKADEGTYVLTVKDVVTKDVTDNLLKASDGSVTGNGSTIFALGNKDGVGFYVVGNGVTVPAGKPYLEIGGTGVKGFLAFNFGTPTAISDLNAQQAERGTIYNLAGQRVNKAVKGIFIQNGKKVVVK